MGSITIQVPARHTKALRRGAAEEIGFDVRALTEKQAALVAAIGDRTDPDAQDVRLQLRYLRGNVAVLEQLNGGPGDDHEVSEDPELLAHIAESAARHEIGPRLADALQVGPIDEREAETIRELTEALLWAVETAVECHKQLHANREAVAV